ncbi:MAG: sigma-70 family RNA polymerase sigma factor [Verrucomicrobia bacterium]|nr:sigma-70 family RNA polymerase sigma factor [Verrucomicrobiota bacterium]
MIEDAELLRRYVEERSEAAFAELVQRHLGLVYATALRRVGGDSQLAEDVSQQVFTEVARRARVLQRRPVLAGWLFTSARFAASKAVRTARRRHQRELEAEIMEKLSPDPATPIDWEKARPVLDDVMGELEEPDREAILLRYFAARDYSSIGARLNLSENAARMRVERALEKLRTRLARRGVTSTATIIATVLAQQTAVAVPAGLATTVTSAALAAGGIAGGAAAGFGSSAALAFMSVSKLQVGLAGALAVATGTGIFLQARNLADLRDEISHLRQQNQAVVSSQAENQRLRSTVAEVAAWKSDDVALAQLRDEAAALQGTLQKAVQAGTGRNAGSAANRPRPTISQRTNLAFQSLKPLQQAKDWAGMMRVLDSLIPGAEPTSYDLALILDMKAKVHLMQNQFREAIAPWERALELSERFNYFDPKMARDIANNLAHLRYQAGLTTQLPPAQWF